MILFIRIKGRNYKIVDVEILAFLAISQISLRRTLIPDKIVDIKYTERMKQIFDVLFSDLMLCLTFLLWENDDKRL
jgi:hypothetical protein